MMHKDIKKHYIQAFSAFFLCHFSKKNHFSQKKARRKQKKAVIIRQIAGTANPTPYLYIAPKHLDHIDNSQGVKNRQTQKHKHAIGKYYLHKCTLWCLIEVLKKQAEKPEFTTCRFSPATLLKKIKDFYGIIDFFAYLCKSCSIRVTYTNKGCPAIQGRHAALCKPGALQAHLITKAQQEGHLKFA